MVTYIHNYFVGWDAFSSSPNRVSEGVLKFCCAWKSDFTSGRSAVLFDRNLQYQTLFIFSCPIKAREVYKVVHSKITRGPLPANPVQQFGSSDAGRTYYVSAYVWYLSSLREGWREAEYIRVNETACHRKRAARCWVMLTFWDVSACNRVQTVTSVVGHAASLFEGQIIVVTWHGNRMFKNVW